MATNFDDLLIGGGGADLLQGLSGNDTLIGLTGNDLIYGGADNDLLEANDGIDQLYGGSGNDVLYAGAGDDRLDGGSGDDLMYGEDGNDSLTGGAGNDTMDGGGGLDTIRGGLGDDNIYDSGVSVTASISGDDGNDTIITSGVRYGAIDGGAGDDTINVSDSMIASLLQVLGGDGNDVIRTASASANGGSGDDTIVFGAYLPPHEAGWTGSFEGGDGYDRFYYAAQYDNYDQRSDVYLDWTKVTGFEEIVLRTLEAGGSYTVEPVVLTDANIGTSGNLLVRPGGAEFAFDYWIDYPTIAYPYSIVVDCSAVTIGHLTLVGFVGQGTLIGGALSDTISGKGFMSGNGGDDSITGSGSEYGGAGNDVLQNTGGGLYGGEGNDALTGTGASSFDGGIGDDTIIAGSGNDSILGGDGNDSISAGDGANTISGGAGDDTIFGGTGTDTVLYSGNMSDYTITPDVDHLIVTGAEGTDLLYQVNFLTFADQTYEVPVPGIIRIGTGDPDYIDGTDGPDSLSGGAGNDTLLGGVGNDTLTGGAGSDSLDGGSGIDTASYADAASGVTVNLATGRATGGETVLAIGAGAFHAAQAPGDRLRDIDNVTGSGFADTLTGNGGANLLDGGASNDSLLGGLGDDTLLGGTGADALFGGGGADSLDGGDGKDRLFGGAGDDTYVARVGDLLFETTTSASGIDAGGIDTVQSAASFSLAATEGCRFIENLVLTGSANAQGTGNGLNNHLTGNAGNNTLDGGLGSDILTGGLGADKFVFSTALSSGNVDQIADFDVAADKIMLFSAVFAGLAAGRLAAGGLGLNATGDATDASDRILYASDTGTLYFDSDGTGSAQKVAFATLSAHLSVVASDFVVF